MKGKGSKEKRYEKLRDDALTRASIHFPLENTSQDDQKFNLIRERNLDRGLQIFYIL